MLRSFHYASFAAAFAMDKATVPLSLEEIGPWREFWYKWVCREFLQSYMEAAQGALFIPESAQELRLLFDAYILEKAVYEIGYELNNRPAWIRIPLQGILEIVEEPVYA